MKRDVRLLPALAAMVGLVVVVSAVLLSAKHSLALSTYVSGAPPTPALETLAFADRVGLLFRGPVVRRPVNEHSPLAVGLDFRTVRRTAADGTGLEGWTLDRASARGEVVLVPGYQQSRDDLLDAGARFFEAGWRVTLMDPRGVGGSEGHRTSLGWYESQDVASFAALARERTLGPVVLYGFSAGGAAVLRALATGEVQGADAAIVEACFSTLREALAVRMRRLGLPALPAADLLLLWGQLEQGVPGYRHNPVDYAGQVKVPVLVLQGREDWRAPPEQGRALAGALSQGRYAEIPDLGHQPGAFGHPIAWSRVVEGFLWETFGPPGEEEPSPRAVRP